MDGHVEGVRKKEEKPFSDKDYTDELVKKWEEPPAEPAALPESAEGAAKENSTEAPAPQQEAPAPQAAATPETEKAKTAEGGTPEVEP